MIINLLYKIKETNANKIDELKVFFVAFFILIEAEVTFLRILNICEIFCRKRAILVDKGYFFVINLKLQVKKTREKIFR